MITITITGPAMSGKSYIAQRVKCLLESMEILTVLRDPSTPFKSVGSKPTYVLGGEITIEVKQRRHEVESRVERVGRVLIDTYKGTTMTKTEYILLVTTVLRQLVELLLCVDPNKKS